MSIQRDNSELADGTQLGVVTAAAVEERKKLRRSVGRLDTTFLMLAAIIVLDTLGAVERGVTRRMRTYTWAHSGVSLPSQAMGG
jgi:hypothetical protein